MLPNEQKFYYTRRIQGIQPVGEIDVRRTVEFLVDFETLRCNFGGNSQTNVVYCNKNGYKKKKNTLFTDKNYNYNFKQNYENLRLSVVTYFI